MKIGHGPATVIGALRKRQPRVRNEPELVEADTLREKECGDEPRYSREAFFCGSFGGKLCCRAWRKYPRRILLRRCCCYFPLRAGPRKRIAGVRAQERGSGADGDGRSGPMRRGSAEVKRIVRSRRI